MHCSRHPMLWLSRIRNEPRRNGKHKYLSCKLPNCSPKKNTINLFPECFPYAVSADWLTFYSNWRQIKRNISNNSQFLPDTLNMQINSTLECHFGATVAALGVGGLRAIYPLTRLRRTRTIHKPFPVNFTFQCQRSVPGSVPNEIKICIFHRGLQNFMQIRSCGTCEKFMIAIVCQHDVCIRVCVCVLW